MGGGKTDALVMESTRQVDKKNYSAIIFRRSYPELTEVIDRSMMLFSQAFPGAHYKSSEHRWIFPSGATIAFGFMDSDEDRLKYLTHEYQFIGFDEGTRFTWKQYSFMLTRCRTSDPTVRCYVRMGTNPGSVGHAWVKARFVDVCPPFEIYTDPDTKMTRCFIPAKIFDNPILMNADPEYINKLGLLSEAERKAYLYGDWNVFQGQVFSEWNEEKHVVEPFAIPDSWPRYRGFDWGSAKPFAVVWFAVDEDGHMWGYREWYGCREGKPNEGIKMNAYDVGAGIAAKEQEERSKGIEVIGVADPACWTNNGNASAMESMMQGYRDATQGQDLMFIKGDNNRLQGLQQIHIRLGRGMLKVFKTCYATIRTLPGLPYDDNKVEDVDTDAEDHIYDCWRYLCMLRQVNAEAPSTEREYLGVDTEVREELEEMLGRRERYDDILGDW